MAYQALYRKWRPKTFDDVVGQEHITETLKRQIITGRTTHAYLFTGTRGTGKTTCAKILSRAVNCESPVNGNPCGCCSSCVGIDNGSIMDVEELDAASNNGVENIRAMREEARFTPTSVRKRVYIVDEVHMLSNSAFNALLKILEEPPEHLIFVLATTELHKVPATILSRCQRYSFRRISAESIAARLKFISENEGFSLTGGAAELLAHLGDGSMRDALSLLDQCCTGGSVDEQRVYSAIGLAGTLKTVELFRRTAARDAYGALSVLGELYADGKDVSSVINELNSLYRDLLLMKLSPSGGSALLSGYYDSATLAELAAALPQEALMNGMTRLTAASSELVLSSDPRLAAELALVKLCDEALTPDLEALSSRVARLEAALAGGAVQYTPIPAPTTVHETAQAVDLPWDEPETKAKPEPKPASEAETKPTPKTAFDWNGVVDGTGASIGSLQKSFLKDRKVLDVSLSDGVIHMAVSNNTLRASLDTPAVLDAIAHSASALMGVDIRVEISAPEQKSAYTPNMEKLERLSRFGNVNIK